VRFKFTDDAGDIARIGPKQPANECLGLHPPFALAEPCDREREQNQSDRPTKQVIPAGGLHQRLFGDVPKGWSREGINYCVLQPGRQLSFLPVHAPEPSTVCQPDLGPAPKRLALLLHQPLTQSRHEVVVGQLVVTSGG
jgi:hypothetical protein